MASLAAGLGLLLLVATFRVQPAVHTASGERIPLLFAGVLLLVSIPIALATRKESRSDVATQILDEGTRAAPNDNPVARLAVMLLLLGLLHGKFMVIDAIKDWWLRMKLRGVDRDRTAVILATLSSRPEGLTPGELLRHGESPERFRMTLAYLIAFEWADVSRDGRHITLLSPAKRAFKR